MSPDRDPVMLLARIDRLERRAAVMARALTAIVVLLGLVVVALLASDREVASAQGRAAVAEEVVARRFKVVDASGKPRALLYVDEQQAVGLALSDPAGQTRVLVNANGASSRLAIIGAQQGFPRIVLAQDGDVQMLNLEDAKTSFIGLLHSGATPSIRVVSGDQSAELGVSEVFTRGKPILTPRLALTQGDRTIATLPAPPAAR
jgi:hypothetical protein